MPVQPPNIARFTFYDRVGLIPFDKLTDFFRTKL